MATSSSWTAAGQRGIRGSFSCALLLRGYVHPVLMSRGGVSSYSLGLAHPQFLMRSHQQPRTNVCDSQENLVAKAASAPKGAPQCSPGQRPGNKPKKGHSPERASHTLSQFGALSGRKVSFSVAFPGRRPGLICGAPTGRHWKNIAELPPKDRVHNHEPMSPPEDIFLLHQAGFLRQNKQACIA